MANCRLYNASDEFVANYATIQLAVNAAYAGYAVVVEDGEWAGFKTARSGSSGLPITISGDTIWGAKIRGTLGNGDGYAIVGLNHDYITLKDLWIKDTTTETSTTKNQAIGIGGSAGVQDITIRGCRISNTYNSGLFSWRSIRTAVIGCVFHDCTHEPTGLGHAIYINDSHPTETTEAHVIIGNVIYDCYDGIKFNAASTGDMAFGGVVCACNVVFDVTGDGIQMGSCWDSYFLSNLVFDTYGKCTDGLGFMSLYHDSNRTYPGDWVQHNNVIANNTVYIDSSYTSKYPAIRLGPKSTQNYVFNNIAIANTLANTILDSGSGNFVDIASNIKKTTTDTTYLSGLFTDYLNRKPPSYDANTYSANYIDPLTFGIRARSGAPSVGAGYRVYVPVGGTTKSAPTYDVTKRVETNWSSDGTFSGSVNRPTPYPGGTYDIGAYQYGADNTNWSYHVLRPSGVFTDTWAWTPSYDISIVQRDPGPVWGWADDDTLYDSYMKSSDLINAVWFNLSNWDETWPQSCMIHNIKVNILLTASSIAPWIVVGLTDTSKNKGYWADRTWNGESLSIGPSIQKVKGTKLCWAEFQVPVSENGKYSKFSPVQMSAMRLGLCAVNPDGASNVKVYAIELECRRATGWWYGKKKEIYTPVES